MVRIYYDPKNEWDLVTPEDVSLEDLFYMVQEEHRSIHGRTKNGLDDMDQWQVDADYNTNLLLSFSDIEALVPNAHWMEEFWNGKTVGCLESLEELYGERELTF